MSPGPTFDRVYLALKQQLMTGRFAPGDHLEPVQIGDELHASITPVRDALHRLAGERLVEAPRSDGFRAPLLTEFALRHLYGLNADLLMLALKGTPAARRADAPRQVEANQHGAGDPAAALFGAIGLLSTNPEHGDAIAATSARLGSARLAEPLVLDGLAEELSGLQGALERHDLARLRSAIPAYHRRRVRSAPQILEAMHRRRPIE